ncbi:adenylate/guanylate cyclase [Planoprotostelium fungivorum]|uniref:Adenylate/guanylate cyclase n=1 Tax=Planoprotostelium fungivorum TaxID=1890364 RepID=A0A2P6N641_9EUKA|nr:adenylate/guanylate cyclase [Planoprotostelium fungivorum]
MTSKETYILQSMAAPGLPSLSIQDMETIASAQAAESVNTSISETKKEKKGRTVAEQLCSFLPQSVVESCLLKHNSGGIARRQSSFEALNTFLASPNMSRSVIDFTSPNTSTILNNNSSGPFNVPQIPERLLNAKFKLFPEENKKEFDFGSLSMEIHSAITAPIGAPARATTKEVPYSRRFRGTLMFTDVANFTPISERMSSLGASGVEMLAKHLNNYFGQVLDLIRMHGGELYKFAGDALISVFSEDAFPLEGKTHEQLVAELTLRAVQCGLDIQHRLNQYFINMADGSSFELRLRIGIGASELQALHVGGVDNYVEYVLDGEAFAQLKTTIEGDSGNVVCSPESWSHVRNLCEGVPIHTKKVPTNNAIPLSKEEEESPVKSGKDVIMSDQTVFLTPSAISHKSNAVQGENYHITKVLCPVKMIPLRPLPDLETLKKMEDSLSSYIQWVVVERIRSGQLLYLGEFRLVTVVFINLTNLVMTKPRGQLDSNGHLVNTLASANRVIKVIQRAVMSHEGFVRQTLVDDKGTVCIVVFGAPVSHEDDAVRGIRAAVQIRKELQDMGQVTSIGITSGKCYCGALGNPTRQEYAVVGDIVNLSARLMKAAEDHKYNVLCDAATYNRTCNSWDFDTHPPVTVKGKAVPIDIYTPLREMKGDRDKLREKKVPVGRQTEKEALKEGIEELKKGHGKFIMIEGEAGMGKSALSAYTRDIAEAEREIVVLEGNSDAIDRLTPYLPWKRIFEEILQIDRTDCLDTVKKNISVYLQGTTWLNNDCLAFLNVIIRHKIEESDYTKSVHGKQRNVQTLDLLTDIFDKFVEQRGKVLLILNDCHALDISSLALLAKIAKRVKSVCMVLTARPFSSPLWNELILHLKKRNLLSHCKLERMSDDEGKSLICDIFKVNSITDEVWKMFSSSWVGNPFYLQEMARSVKGSNVLVVNEGQCDVNLSAGNTIAHTIPESIEQIITSSIDALPLQQQLLLKVASVIGEVFDFVTLRGIFPIREHIGTLPQSLQALVAVGIVVEDRHHGHFRFNNSMIRDVSYNLLLNSQKIELHMAVASYIENNFENYISYYYTILAYHLCNAVILKNTGVDSTTVISAVNYLLKSIELSKESYADEEARSKCQLGLQVVERLPADHPERRHFENTLYLRLAMITQQISSFEEASEYYNKSKLPSLSDTIGMADVGMFHFKRKSDDEESGSMLPPSNGVTKKHKTSAPEEPMSTQ